MPEEETEIQKLAEYARKFFEGKRRPPEGREEGEAFYTFKSRYPTWLYDMSFAVHDDGKWLPDDYKYEYMVDALDSLSEGMHPDEPELQPDVYTSDLIKWLASHNFRTVYVDDAVEEMGWDKKRGIEGAIADGQWREKEEVFRIVVNALEERLEDIENGELEEFKGKGPAEGMLDWEPTS